MGRVLVACEYSGRVREAFAAQGHDAWSCDMLPTEQPGQHYQGDVRDMLAQEWDLMVCHPPCTYLTSAGARWWPGRQAEQAEALDFVRLLLGANIPRIALENPAGRIGTQVRKADQYVHPWQFGHMETKTTGLWLVGLPHLTPTKVVREEMDKLPAHQKHRVHYMSPGPDRWKERSRTFEGIALAMAEQWGPLLPFNREIFAYDIEEIVSEYDPGQIVSIECAQRLPSFRVLVTVDEDGNSYEYVDAAIAAQQGDSHE